MRSYYEINMDLMKFKDFLGQSIHENSTIFRTEMTLRMAYTACWLPRENPICPKGKQDTVGGFPNVVSEKVFSKYEVRILGTFLN